MPPKIPKGTIVTLSDEQLTSLADIVSTKIDAKLKAREEFVDKRLDNLQAENDLLKEKTDDLEQRNRLENLRVFGIPEKSNENTDQLVIDLAKKLNVTLDKSHISRSHRVGRKNGEKPRAIIVKFVSYASRQKMFMAKKQLKGTGTSIKEDLTQIRQNILRKASENFDEVWSQNGVIIIKDGEDYHRIRTVRKLNELIGTED